MEPNFVPTMHLLYMVDLLDRCKCELCQKEKRRIEDRISSTNPIEIEKGSRRKTFAESTSIVK